MFRLIKSVVLCSAVVGGTMFAAAPQAQAGGWGLSFYGGSPSYGYSPYGYNSYSNYGGYGGGYGYQSFYNTPGSNFRGYSNYGGYGHHHHHHHCR